MAKRRGRKRTSSKVVYRRGPVHTRTVQPIVVRAAAAPVHHKRRRHHSSGGFGVGGAAGGLASKENIALGMGALALGFIDKNQDKFNIPTVPLIGRKGSIAVLAHFGGRYLHWPILGKVSKAAIVLALYELGREGKISGVDEL